MNIHDIKIIKSDERGMIYDCGKSNFIHRKKWSISADHHHTQSETIYLVAWEIELTIWDETQIVHAPVMFTISWGIYHKLIALTDIDLVIDRYEML